MNDDQYRYHVQAKITRARLGGVRWPTPREIADWLCEAQHAVTVAREASDAAKCSGEQLALLYECHMQLARARCLNGEAAREVRNELIRATSQIETIFRGAFTLAGEEIALNDPEMYRQRTELRILEGIVAALMGGDFEAARRIASVAPMPLGGADAAETLLEERSNFLGALMHHLLGRASDTQQTLWQSTRRFRSHRVSGTDARTYYFTLHTALRGIVERDANAFNTGLAAHLEFYQWMTHHNGSEVDRAASFVCDTALALANLGAAGRLKVWTRHLMLPATLVGQANSTYH